MCVHRQRRFKVSLSSMCVYMCIMYTCTYIHDIYIYAGAGGLLGVVLGHACVYAYLAYMYVYTYVHILYVHMQQDCLGLLSGMCIYVDTIYACMYIYIHMLFVCVAVCCIRCVAVCCSVLHIYIHMLFICARSKTTGRCRQVCGCVYISNMHVGTYMCAHYIICACSRSARPCSQAHVCTHMYIIYVCVYIYLCISVYMYVRVHGYTCSLYISIHAAGPPGNVSGCHDSRRIHICDAFWSQLRIFSLSGTNKHIRNPNSRRY